METTTNYKLPQWVKADQIKMDDFNGAFGKIDTALKANADAAASKASSAELNAVRQDLAAAREANCLVKLAGPLVTTTENGTLNFDLSQVDMTKIAALFVVFSISASSGTASVSANDSVVSTICSNNNSTSAGIVWLMPLNDTIGAFSTYATTRSNASTMSNGANTSVAWTALTKVTISGTSYSGATATLFAVKK